MKNGFTTEEWVKYFIRENNSNTEIPVEMKPLQEYEKIMSDLGYQKHDYDSNGWQVDFWYYFINKEQEIICLSGSLHYGDWKLTKEKAESPN